MLCLLVVVWAGDSAKGLAVLEAMKAARFLDEDNNGFIDQSE